MTWLAPRPLVVPKKFPSPAYWAVMVCVPWGRAEVVKLATLASALEGLDTDEFAITRIVAFVQLMAPAKLGPHSIPQELH